MARALELTWVAKLKRWRKRRKVDGKSKTFYLGTGDGKHDRVGYARALAKWREIEKALDHAERGEQLRREYEEWRNELIARPAVDPTIHVVVSMSEVDQSKPLSASGERWLEGRARMGEDRAATTPAATPKGKSLGECIDAYIEEQRQRYEHGLKFPNAPQRERISGVRFISYRFNAQVLQADWRDEPLPKDEATLAGLIKRFRDSQKALMADGKIQPGTVNERIKTMRHVVRWMHDQYLIPTLPRQMVHLCAAYTVKTTAKAIDLDTIHRLWAAATPRLKTYMALGLNCGFYVGDIASLEYDHIKDGYILKDRHKTNVPTRFKLWAVTRSLLGENCNGKDKLALVTDDGGPLYFIDPYANGGKGKRWCKIETDLLALRKRLKIKSVTFSMFRDTSSTKIESIDRTVTDLFDGHKDGRMARFYVDGDKIDYDRMFAGLDAALEELERYYALSAGELG
ncbi:MAG: hypothetical protein JWN40_1962 [Phycisphaerales bacterium]|nr:hypothetical protein [Phycisphaerales bacterium]